MQRLTANSALIDFIPGAILSACALGTACVAAVGIIRGFRTWWGFLLIVPAILVGLYSGFILLVLFPSFHLTLESLLGTLLLLFPVVLAIFLVWRWWLPERLHGA
jgi:hypothetical protein